MKLMKALNELRVHKMTVEKIIMTSTLLSKSGDFGMNVLDSDALLCQVSNRITVRTIKMAHNKPK